MSFRIVNRKEAGKRWKEEMKHFTSYKNRNEDFLFFHNHSKKYMVGENKEFIQQLEVWAKMGLVLYKQNTRIFDYKGKKYVMITINGDNIQGTDGDTISEMAFALSFMVSGFSYLFKYHSYKEIEKDIKKTIKYIKNKEDSEKSMEVFKKEK